MTEIYSQILVEEFQKTLHRPLTDEEINFLYWVGEESNNRAMAHTIEKNSNWTETML